MTEEDSDKFEEENTVNDEDIDNYKTVRDFKEFSLPEDRNKLLELLNNEYTSVDNIIPNKEKFLVFYSSEVLLEGEELKEHLNKRRARREQQEAEMERRNREIDEIKYNEKIRSLKEAATLVKQIYQDKGYCALKTQRDRTVWLQVKYGIQEKSMLSDINELSLPEMKEILDILLKN